MPATFGLALGVEASDAGVELGSLILVDPSRWYPFRQTITVHPAGPAFLQEMGVVISAKQGQIIKIGKTTENPIQDVVSVAPAGGMSTPGERTSAVSYVQGHGLAWGGDPSGSSQREGDVVVVDDGGPDVSFISNPEQLLGGELGAVGGSTAWDLGANIGGFWSMTQTLPRFAGGGA